MVINGGKLMLKIMDVSFRTWNPNGGAIENITFNFDMYKGSPEDQFFQFLVSDCGFADIKVLKEFNINHEVLERISK